MQSICKCFSDRSLSRPQSFQLTPRALLSQEVLLQKRLTWCGVVLEGSPFFSSVLFVIWVV